MKTLHSKPGQLTKVVLLLQEQGAINEVLYKLPSQNYIKKFMKLEEKLDEENWWTIAFLCLLFGC